MRFDYQLDRLTATSVDAGSIINSATSYTFNVVTGACTFGAVAADSLTSRVNNTNLSLSGAGTGIVYVNDKLGVRQPTVDSTTVDIQTSNDLGNRKIVLFTGGNNDHQFYGMGINSGTFRFQLNSTSDNYVFYAGASASASNEVFQVRGGGGIRLPTTGGTQTTLDYYEEYTSSGNTWTGIWAASQNGEYRVVKIGRTVFIFIPEITATATVNTFIQATSALPTRFRPAANNFWIIRIINNTVIQDGLLQISSAGVLSIYINSGGGAFTASGTGGFYPTSITMVL